MCTLPREVEARCAEFKAFYLRTHSGRKLSWQTNMGNAGVPSQCRNMWWPGCARIMLDHDEAAVGTSKPAGLPLSLPSAHSLLA